MLSWYYLYNNDSIIVCCLRNYLHNVYFLILCCLWIINTMITLNWCAVLVLPIQGHDIHNSCTYFKDSHPEVLLSRSEVTRDKLTHCSCMSYKIQSSALVVKWNPWWLHEKQKFSVNVIKFWRVLIWTGRVIPLLFTIHTFLIEIVNQNHTVV